MTTQTGSSSQKDHRMQAFRREPSFINHKFATKTKDAPAVAYGQRPPEAALAYSQAAGETSSQGTTDNYMSNNTKYENWCLDTYFKANEQMAAARQSASREAWLACAQSSL